MSGGRDQRRIRNNLIKLLGEEWGGLMSGGFA